MRSLDQIRRKTRGHPIMFGSSNAAIDTSFSPGCIFAVVFVVVYQSDTRLPCTIEFIALRICSFCIRYIIEQETRALLQRGQQNKILKSRRRTVPECPVERGDHWLLLYCVPLHYEKKNDSTGRIILLLPLRRISHAPRRITTTRIDH